MFNREQNQSELQHHGVAKENQGSEMPAKLERSNIFKVNNQCCDVRLQINHADIHKIILYG